ncbi:MAG: MerR family transcriptional regulator [Myxococcota bacterium]|nr:MerR family transcriptional regulator [Myxococcota bacterium]
MQGELPLGGRPKSRKLGPESPIPEKLYFKIGEVSQLVGVRAHVLRYWEKEVPSIRPGKSASNQRRYRYRDVEIFREIRRLLHEERYTLAGARKRIMAGEKGGALPPPEPGDMEAVPLPESSPRATIVTNPDPSGDDVRLDAPIFQQRRKDMPSIAADTGLPLRFAGASHDKIERVRQGLRELIRLVDEEP